MEPQLLASQPQQYSIRRYNHRRHSGEGGGPVEMTKEASHPDGGESSATVERRGGGDVRRAAPDRNLASLCDHVQLEGFNNGMFSDVVLNAMGSTYHLHRLLLSRSSYFRNMLQGPWKEAKSPVLTLHVDDKNVNSEAMEMALAYLYGHYPKLNDDNAFRVLAAASFLDLQDLCAICTDFIIAELWSSNFLTFQVFAESQDYGTHGERVRNACWGYLCQSGSKELKEVLPKLSSQTLLALLTSDELWVPSEEKRFELALCTLLAKGAHGKTENHEQRGSSCEVVASAYSGSSRGSKKHSTDESRNSSLETERGHSKTIDNFESRDTARNILVELADSIVDSCSEVSTFDQAQTTYCESNPESGYYCNTRGPSTSNTFSADDSNVLCSYLNIQNCTGMSGSAGSGLAVEGPSDEDPCYQLNSSWPSGDQMHCVSINTSCNVLMSNEWEKCNISPLTWGGRTVGRREVKTSLNQQCGMSQEDYDSFVNIFEGGSLLYCNMSFEALLNVRKHLEEMGFPCKAVDDGLWLQMLLSQRVQEIGAATCKNCCRVGIACACRQSFGYYIQDEHSNLSHNDMGHVYINNSALGERSGHFRPVRVHDRGPIDGLAGIGRGTTFVPASAWPPTRYVFSRVPFGIGNRGNQQPPANDDPDNRGDNTGDIAGDGLTALVGLSQGSNDAADLHELQIGRDYETTSSGGGIPVQIMNSNGDAMGIEWENENRKISLDMKTPLSHFPPFRFAVEFQEVLTLCDGQVKHSPEAFYAGSLWKVGVEQEKLVFRLLAMKILKDVAHSVHMYVDSREKVTARYQLICPSKREVMVFGSYKQTGTLLPKAPKGWGWRTALLFDELDDLLQNGALRVAAVVQLI
ncbi:BTB/POZ domain-containing protein [Striga asiatica]|uniref:BTB/POZ domain-containing protein n=1 Tax=Striga asiatica TaxID=4170 RepID=A0A5A7PKQ9_STRAF|nr:BTB/POZ domain-containing protein [Striga asiatica]